MKIVQLLNLSTLIRFNSRSTSESFSQASIQFLSKATKSFSSSQAKLRFRISIALIQFCSSIDRGCSCRS
ncbi:unnamed protein product [Trifolium pratense]|uniref:Uncharacterized protein n=1 Tax=Trifolium pratense TaxID=57577 RepID=A0ACB0J1R3_TRIPR|nr:unnamed protein product [Trifolium pratense]